MVLYQVLIEVHVLFGVGEDGVIGFEAIFVKYGLVARVKQLGYMPWSECVSAGTVNYPWPWIS